MLVIRPNIQFNEFTEFFCQPFVYFLSYNLCTAAMPNYYYFVLLFQKDVILFSVVNASHNFIILPSNEILSFAILGL